MGDSRFGLTLGAVVIALVFVAFPNTGHGAQITNRHANYRVTYPRGWRSNTRQRTVTLATGRIPPHKHVPPGGALVTVNVFPPDDHPPFKLARSDEANLMELARGQKIVSQTPRTTGQPAKIIATDSTLNLRTAWLVRHVDDRTFLVMLQYGADNPKAAKFETVMDRVAASITLVNTTRPH